jgi:acid phosphatase (class A)
MRKPEAVVFALMTFALAACAGGLGAATPPVAVPAMAPVVDPAGPAVRITGFLDAVTTPGATAIIPPAPKEGEARNTADWAIFKATRALEGSERWKLAINDDNYTPPAILKDFSCAMDAELTVQTAPTLSRVLSRAATDAANAAAATKDVYKRTRPYLLNEGAICIARSEGLAKSYDYPSGHASASWIEGLILAQLAPDRSEKLLARARAYGESRIVCGVHNWSAVEGGRTNAAGVFAAMQASADYQSELIRAKAELAAVRASGRKPDAAACAKEFELTRPLVVN